jgi:hypothetical protein
MDIAGDLLLAAAPSVLASALAHGPVPSPDDAWDLCRQWSESWPCPPWPPAPDIGDGWVRWCRPVWECDPPMLIRSSEEHE